MPIRVNNSLVSETPVEGIQRRYIMGQISLWELERNIQWALEAEYFGNYKFHNETLDDIDRLIAEIQIAVVRAEEGEDAL